MNPLKKKSAVSLSSFPYFFLFNEKICSASSSTSEESSLPLPFFFFLPLGQKYWKCVFFFFKPDYFMCQSTILGKKRFPRSVLCSAKSVNKQTKKNNKSHLFLNKRNLSYKKGLEAMNWQVTGRDSCLNI